VLLKAAFDLAAAGSSATYEIPYGSIERPTTRGNSWEQARFEVPALRWADLGDGSHGLSLINDSKYGYDAVGNRLRLTLLRSPTWPAPGADRGRQQFRYALYPHAGSWKQARTVRHGYEFNNPLIARQVAPHPGTLPAEQSLLSVEQDHVVLTAVKKAEDSDALILHLYEWAGEGGDIDIRLPAGARSAALSNLVEQQAGAALPLAGSRLRVPIHPYEIVTINVGYSPAAVEGR
jgi:alpha-mannosidase